MGRKGISPWLDFHQTPDRKLMILNQYNFPPAGGGGNWWEAGGASGVVAAYQPLGAPSSAAALVNVANPGTYDITESSAGWNASYGWSFNGSQFLKTNFITAGGYTVLIRCDEVTNAGGTIFGVSNGGDLRIVGDNSSQVVFSNGNPLSVAPAFYGGIIGMAGRYACRDGVIVGDIGGVHGPITQPIWVGCLNVEGAFPDGFSAHKTQAFVVFDNVLTEPQIAAICAAMAAL